MKFLLFLCAFDLVYSISQTNNCYAQTKDQAPLKVECSEDAKKGCWEEPLEKIHISHNNKSPNGFSFSPDGSKIVSTFNDGVATIVDVNSGKEKNIIKDGTLLYYPSFSPDGKKIAFTSRSTDHLGNDTYAIKVFDSESGTELFKTNTTPFGWKFSLDSKKILTENGEIFDLLSGKEVFKTVHPNQFSSFSPDGSSYIEFIDNCFKVVSASSKKDLFTITCGVSDFGVPYFTQDGKKIILTSYEAIHKPGTYKTLILDVLNGNKILSRPWIGDITSFPHISDDGTKSFIFLKDGLISLIDNNSGKELWKKALDCSHQFKSTPFSLDGKKLILVCSDGTRIIDIDTQKETIIKKSTEEFNHTFFAIFSPDGNNILLSTFLGTGIFSTTAKKFCVSDFTEFKDNSWKKTWYKYALDKCTLQTAFQNLPQGNKLVKITQMIKNHSNKLITMDLDLNSDLPLEANLQILLAKIDDPNFKPSQAIAIEAIETLTKQQLADQDNIQTEEAIVLLLIRSGVTLTPELLSKFKFKAEDLEKEISEILLKTPSKYTGLPNLAALKMGKYLLDQPDDKYACEKTEFGDEQTKDSKISLLLNYLFQFGDKTDSDRNFFSKIVRVLLEKKPICKTERSQLLRSLKNWESNNASIQYDIACMIGQKIEPLSQYQFGEWLNLANYVGLKSELNESSWLEQIKAYGESKDITSTAANAIYDGLLGYAVGVPEGKLHFEKTNLPVHAHDGHKGSFVKLCRILNRQIAGPIEDAKLAINAQVFFQKVRDSLDKKRAWPEGFETEAPDQTLRELLSPEDLTALESGCKTLPTKSPTNTFKHKHRRKNKDFNPEGR